MDPLAPYPPPSEKQDRLVHRVEIFANGLKKISHVIKLPFYPVSKLKKKILKRKWQERAQAVPRDELIAPQEQAVYVANSTHAMDHNFFYILKNGRIWYKPIAAPQYSTWLLFGPDGLPPSGLKLSSISSDGRNLVAIDEEGIVNYVHSNDINFVVTDNGWKIKDINLDWTDRWLAIPVVKNIVELLRSNHLKLPDDCIAFAISQKGPETAYYTDMNGKKQPEFLVGVTTLYALCKNGRIFFADPWLGNGFRNEITAPRDGQFVAENMAAAASTIFLIRRDENGRAEMYTRFADFDSTGSDPLLPASYDPDNEIPLVRRIPGEDWIKQPEIPLEKQARLTSQISVIQTGRGQNNRQLRVEGTNANGEPGFYFKRIYENQWHFELTPGQTLEFKNPPQLSEPPSPPVDLNGEIFTNKANTPLKTVALKKFLHHGLNERGLHTVIELTLNNGRKLTLPLYARRGLVHLFGKRNNLPNWQLVMPNEYKLDRDIEVKTALKVIFKNKMHISVSVNEFTNGDIEIYNKHKRFKFAFTASAPNDNLPASQHSIQIHRNPLFRFVTTNTIISDSANESKRDVARATATDIPAPANSFYANGGSSRLSLFSNGTSARILEATEQPEMQHSITLRKAENFLAVR